MFPGTRPPMGPPPFHHRRRPHNPAISILNYFRTSNGEIDLDKVSKTIGTVGQLIHQVDPIIKQVTPFLKGRK